MTEEEALAAIEAGIDSVKKCKEDGVTLLATGDGNWKHDDKQRSGGGIVKL